MVTSYGWLKLWESAFVSDWLRKKRAFPRPITERTAAKPILDLIVN